MGKLASKEELKLSFKTGGIISEIFVDEGQTVKKGQVLAKLNLSEIQAQVNQAILGLDKAERDYRRANNLYKDSVVTLEQLQNTTTALDIAKSNVKIAEFNLQFSTIKAQSLQFQNRLYIGEYKFITIHVAEFALNKVHHNSIIQVVIL